MLHPLFQRSKHVLYYFATWIIPAAIHFLSMHNLLQVPAGNALLDTGISIVLYAVMGLSLWYLTYGIVPGKQHFVSFLGKHFFGMMVFIFVWLMLSELIYYLFTGSRIQEMTEGIRLYKVLEGSLFYFILITMYYVMSYHQDMKEREIRQVNLARNLREAELKVLKSQINPHFLFNSLNSVASLSVTAPERARSMIVRLSDYMRYSLKTSPDDMTELENEIENCRRYLEIEQARFGEKLRFGFDVPPKCKSIKIPVLCLQPLYENAVKHGVYESDDLVEIETAIDCSEQFLHIRIANDYDPEAPVRKGEGIGISSVRKRLNLLYDAGGLLKTNKADGVFIVDLYIPKS
ncbi:MAG: sensor histidine kinase [Bacteroidales bacterium]